MSLVGGGGVPGGGGGGTAEPGPQTLELCPKDPKRGRGLESPSPHRARAAFLLFLFLPQAGQAPGQPPARRHRAAPCLTLRPGVSAPSLGGRAARGGADEGLQRCAGARGAQQPPRARPAAPTLFGARRWTGRKGALRGWVGAALGPYPSTRASSARGGRPVKLWGALLVAGNTPVVHAVPAAGQLTGGCAWAPHRRCCPPGRRAPRRMLCAAQRAVAAARGLGGGGPGVRFGRARAPPRRAERQFKLLLALLCLSRVASRFRRRLAPVVEPRTLARTPPCSRRAGAFHETAAGDASWVRPLRGGWRRGQGHARLTSSGCRGARLCCARAAVTAPTPGLAERLDATRRQEARSETPPAAAQPPERPPRG